MAINFTFATMNMSENLVGWYNIHKRHLPFRITNDPYKIWLSEIILQQTRVEQGLPYYHRFAEKFPDVFFLANAKEEQILKLWQGLGYYSRGRNMHQTAKEIVNVWNGNFPKSYDDLLKLKGVGSYTAAAISSFAFNQPHAVADGNVMRVLSRLFAVKNAVNSTEGKRIISALADEVLDKANPRIHNYAMMELGALVCKPHNPLCSECPIVNFCEAFRLKKQHVFPVKQKKAVSQNRYLFYLVMRYKNKVYIRKRTENGIWKNLYDFPLIESSTRKSAKQVMKSSDFKSFLTNSYSITSISEEYKHVLTHRTLYAVFISIKLKKALLKSESSTLIAVTLDELHSQYAMPRLIEKYIIKFSESQTT